MIHNADDIVLQMNDISITRQAPFFSLTNSVKQPILEIITMNFEGVFSKIYHCPLPILILPQKKSIHTFVHIYIHIYTITARVCIYM